MNKIDLLQATLYALKPDIVGITESWAGENMVDAELMMPGYCELPPPLSPAR
jgi:hypothetical protein